MNRWISTLVVMAAIVPAASAQSQIGSYSRPQTNPHPAISPYVNLGRTGFSPATEYFGIVRPQLETQQSLQNLQVGLEQVNTGLQSAQETPVMGSGHSVTFFNYSHYFPTGGSRFASGPGGTIFAGGGTVGNGRR